MLALLLTILALSVGPLIHRLVLPRPAAVELLDAFTAVSVGGLVMLQIIPGTLHLGGWPAALAAVLGVVSPVLAEELLHRAAERVHRLFLGVAMIGIGLHAFFDGIALADPGGDEHTSLLALAVIIHSVPVGLTVSWLLLEAYGISMVLGTLAFMIISTVAGFVAAPHLPGHGGGAWLAVLQAFVAGSLVHVLVHQPHPHGERARPLARQAAIVTGCVAASGVLAFLLISHEHERAPLWLILVTAPVFALFLLLHFAPAGWSHRFAPWRRHSHAPDHRPDDGSHPG